MIDRAAKLMAFVAMFAGAASGVAASADSPAAPSSPATGPATSPTVVWLSTLDEGYKDAARRQRPILVIYGADWCVPCRELQKELDKPVVREKLADWTLVHLDVDKQEAGAPPYVGPIPALRILTSDAKPVASVEGAMPSEEFLRWLAENAPKAGLVDPDLVASTEPAAADLARLVVKLGGADSATREAVIARLRPWRKTAPAVVDAFADGNLRMRLAALDLLGEWSAPIAGLDPWQPQTVTPARIDALRKWSTSAASQTQPASTQAAQSQGIEQDFGSLLQASDPLEARVYAERLARSGPALLPQVHDRLNAATSDRDRERLTALRYRLVAGEAAELQWPGGLERLASSDAAVRHEAAEELVHRATAADAPLLLELFTNPDPLVREISLRGLQGVSGADGAAALVRLLGDPVANVRAAVLKQLAETPSPQATDAVIAYVAKENDPDLLVHAVRVLRAAKGQKSVDCLIGLLKHDSWRVRAEAVDALAEIFQDRNGAQASSEQAASEVAKLLDDPDGFVAGRAMAAMKPLGRGQVFVMSEAAKRHPELAMELIRLLVSDHREEPAAIRTLRSLCAHENANVRAAAAVGLASVVPNNCDAEILSALRDSQSNVRQGGAQAMFSALQQQRPPDGFIYKPSFFGFGGGRVKVDPNQWLDQFRRGANRPSWMAQTLPELQKMLSAKELPERVAAALPLAALGQDQQALPILIEAAKNDIPSRHSAARLLGWLPWDKRLELFNTLSTVATDDRTLAELVENMAAMNDPRAADPLWNLLAKHTNLAGPVYGGLLQSFTGERYRNASQDSSPGVKAMGQFAKSKLTDGDIQRRVVALALLYSASVEDAAAEAEKIRSSPDAPATLKVDALHILLLADKDKAKSLAVTAVSSSDPSARKLALNYLANGANAISELRDGVDLPTSDMESFFGNGKPIKIDPPADLSPDVLMPLLSGADREEAAYAGYLLCLMGKKEGLPPLIAYWKSSQGERFGGAPRLVYRAISALDDDSQTPVLEQIYASLGDSRQYLSREFYWTIRSMHGPNVLKLRKKIRDEVGMQQLQ